MTKRIFSGMTALLIAFTIAIPILGVDAYGAARTSLPSYTSSIGKTYYYSDNNIFYKYNYGPPKKHNGSYVKGNCTWYAYGRASELLGKPLNTDFRWNASAWWNTNKRNNCYPYGSRPKVGAIACYNTHVAIVEKVINGKPYVSESGWTLSSRKPTSASQIVFHYGTPWVSNPKGYIYILDSKSESVKNVDYSVKITAKDLNMRTGPGSEYSRIGYVKPGTYEVSQECGNWAKLESNGYWICLTYAEKVKTPEKPVVDTGTAVSYSVKVSITNLNMRTGPGTKYKRIGYIKPGTYKLTRTSNGWGKISSNGYWIYLKYTTKVKTTPENTDTSAAEIYKVKVTASDLYMRTGPGTRYSTKGFVRKGVIYDIKDTKNGWGQLSKNGYWIKLSYTVPVSSSFNVKVTAMDLNMRTGPSTKYKRVGYIKPGIYTIRATKNGWGQLSKNKYWIKLSYVKKI